MSRQGPWPSSISAQPAGTRSTAAPARCSGAGCHGGATRVPAIKGRLGQGQLAGNHAATDRQRWLGEPERAGQAGDARIGRPGRSSRFRSA